MHALAAYNIHKRATLDRISSKYHYRARIILRDYLQDQIPSIERALREGRRQFNPRPGFLEEHLTDAFEAHLKETVRVALADGIREVTPDGQLSTWTQFPLEMPVELTLTPALASDADDGVRRFLDRRSYLVKNLTKFVTSITDQYLRGIRAAYSKSAFEWLDGEGDESLDDVIDKIQQVYSRSESDSMRIFRTETTSYFNESRHDYFSDKTTVSHMELYAVTDGRVSEICESRHGFVVTIEKAGLRKYMPPFHPNCRTIQRPLLEYLPSHKAIIERGLAMSESSFAPLPRGWAS